MNVTSVRCHGWTIEARQIILQWVIKMRKALPKQNVKAFLNFLLYFLLIRVVEYTEMVPKLVLSLLSFALHILQRNCGILQPVSRQFLYMQIVAPNKMAVEAA
jgi:hypothetical protein